MYPRVIKPDNETTTRLPFRATIVQFFNLQIQWISNCHVWLLKLVGGLEHFLFFHILGMSSSQLTNSCFSRWLLHHQPGRVFWVIFDYWFSSARFGRFHPPGWRWPRLCRLPSCACQGYSVDVMWRWVKIYQYISIYISNQFQNIYCAVGFDHILWYVMYIWITHALYDTWVSLRMWDTSSHTGAPVWIWNRPWRFKGNTCDIFDNDLGVFGGGVIDF